MLIDFLGITHNDKVYFRLSDHSSSVFTSNNNLSFRRSVFSDSDNLYVDQMLGGEDMYICMKLISKGKKYLVDPTMIVEHFPRTNLRSLGQQFFNYGSFGTSALKHLGLHSFEVLYDTNLFRPSSNYKFLFKFKSPLPAVIHLNWFFVCMLLSFLIPFYPVPILSLLIPSILMYVRTDLVLFHRLGVVNAISIIFIKTLVNLNFILGALSHLLKDGVLYIPPAILHPFIRPIIKSSRKWNIDQSTTDIISHMLMQKKLRQKGLLNGKYLRVNLDRKVFVLKRKTFLLDWYQIIDVVDL